MIRFAELFPDREIVSTVSRQSGWSHSVERFQLAAPWRLAIAPAGWDQFGGDLLVGNNNAGPDGNTELNA
jgi:hypothetical protein